MKPTDMRHGKRGVTHLVYRLYSTKNGAKVRGLSWGLTRDQAVKLITGDCAYCGAPPNPVNGIDRVDNTLGYTPENCVPCCSWCNHAKATDSAADFIEHCRRVAR